MKKARNLTKLGYRRIVILLLSLVVVPTGLLLLLGVWLLFLGDANLNLLFGILLIALGGALVTGVILVWVFVAREANLSLLQSDFVSKISHELKTPLTSIKLFSETLASRSHDEVIREKCVEGLLREGTRLEELIERLLEWGRMETGNRRYEKIPTDLSDVIRDAVEFVQSLTDSHGGKIETRIEENLGLFLLDRRGLTDAVVNLLGNALKYGGEPPLVELILRRNDADIEIAVRDNGRGIHQGEQKRIFLKFYRVDDRLSREREGSGLGLAIVQHVVRAHSGKIAVESRLGNGSTFTIRLPIAKLAAAASNQH